MSKKIEDKRCEKVFKTVSYLEAPAKLNARQREIWKDIVHSMSAGYYKECDIGLIVQYIYVQHTSEVLMSELMQEDTTTVSDKGVVMVNKKISALDKLAGTSATLAQKLGFAPSTRNRADIKDPAKSKKPVSEMDSLLD